MLPATYRRANAIRGKRYVYWQIKLPGGSFKRKSLGVESEETQALIVSLLERKKNAEEAIAALKSTTRSFVASCGMSIEAAHFKVLELLARSGLFSKGVVVVGSHAFASNGNALGMRWGAISRLPIWISSARLALGSPSRIRRRAIMCRKTLRDR